jgi:Fungal Zn(2)-Cys(6) binuclear cluster domain
MFSPQSFNNGYNNMTDPNAARFGSVPPQHSHHLRERGTIQYTTPYPGRAGYTRNGVLPTPDPTVASCISDEDVARTLIALGDASNYSHGRTSNSTIDETFSGAADAASSTGATSDSDEYSDDEGGPPKHRRHLNEEDDEYDGVIKSEYSEIEGAPKTKKVKTKMHDGPAFIRRSKSTSSTRHKTGKITSNTMGKPSKMLDHSSLTKVVSAPVLPTQARKTSSSSSINMQSQFGADDEDLSSKPRCQRCRKSKKGCDRQRPCQRCKDAGIGIEGCVSEDEGNGRKGRFGRHMGVSIKKPTVEAFEDSLMLPPVGGLASPEHSKKRKR